MTHSTQRTVPLRDCPYVYTYCCTSTCLIIKNLCRLSWLFLVALDFKGYCALNFIFISSKFTGNFTPAYGNVN
jgi:hypothetical protein